MRLCNLGFLKNLCTHQDGQIYVSTRKMGKLYDPSRGRKCTDSVTTKTKIFWSIFWVWLHCIRKGELLPFCLLCSTTLGKESMNPTKLKRHLETKHPDHQKKPIVFFETLHSNLHKQLKALKKFMAVSDQAQFASFKIAQLLAKM